MSVNLTKNVLLIFFHFSPDFLLTVIYMIVNCIILKYFCLVLSRNLSKLYYIYALIKKINYGVGKKNKLNLYFLSNQLCL